jgi:DNA-binding PadR family transcriptional regulator
MKTIEINPEDRLPLTPAVFHILLALTDGELHGYAIMREVAENTNGQVKMGPGTLYGTVKRLLEAGLVEESDRRPDSKADDERRRYYRLTGVGQRVVEAEANRYNEMAKLARRKRLLGKLTKPVPAGGI